MIRKLTILLCAFALLLGTTHSGAGPIQSELKSYKCLIPDFLTSSGGTSPALSPDGTTLVYLTQHEDDWGRDKVWVLTDADKQLAQKPGDPPAQPWELKIDDMQEQIFDNSMARAEYRDVDWSRDGRRVAFIKHGRLYVAELADLKAKEAKSRKLADMISNPGSDDAPNRGPRWSPDGTRIAFFSPNTSVTSFCQAYVVDVGTGKVTMVANDVVPASYAWEQPWSPDGRLIVYGSMKTRVEGDHMAADMGGISIVSAGGGTPRRVTGEQMTCCPSWSPLGNLLAYVGPTKQGVFSGALSTVIYLADARGKKATVAASADAQPLTPAVRNGIRDRVIKTLKEDYPGLFTTAQLGVLSRSRTDEKDTLALLLIAENRMAAESIGGQFLWKMKWMTAHITLTSKSISEAFQLARKALLALPADKQKSINTAVNARYMEIAKPLLTLQCRLDRWPAWSPDGKRLAFIRGNAIDGQMRLLVMDVATKKVRTVFESNSIGNVSWTGGGKLLLLQTKRDLAYSRETAKDSNPMDAMMSQWNATVTTMSYPEIWLIEPK